MDLARLLAPFLPAPLTTAQLDAISRYLDLLLRWNARINLTAVRDPQEIVTRHFGESLFTAARLLAPDSRVHAVDVGSGAGFPGLPLKIYAPVLRLTLIESQNKKATFLKEVARTLALGDVEVFTGRAETYLGGDPRAGGVARAAFAPVPVGLVTLRAVERFESILPVAASLVSPDGEMGHGERNAGRLALLISAAQHDRACTLLPHFAWDEPIAIPHTTARVLLVGHLGGQESKR